METALFNNAHNPNLFNKSVLSKTEIFSENSFSNRPVKPRGSDEALSELIEPLFNSS